MGGEEVLSCKFSVLNKEGTETVTEGAGKVIRKQWSGNEENGKKEGR